MSRQVINPTVTATISEVISTVVTVSELSLKVSHLGMQELLRRLKPMEQETLEALLVRVGGGEASTADSLTDAVIKEIDY